jgi:oligopeptide/dipeptide ABC transporter ATP-binding protein
MSTALLQVEDLAVRYPVRDGILNRGSFTAVDAVSFTLAPGETLGLVGESGSGKSTLVRAIMRLIPLDRGRVTWCGEDLLALSGPALRSRRRDMQIVFQDPLASLDPLMTVREILAEPLRIHEPSCERPERERRIAGMLERVGLTAPMANRFPHEFSGGQCQRIAIARAVMLAPRMLVCDEAVSSLDVSIQGQIVNLLADLQRELGMAMIFISHNLHVIRHISHRVAVLYAGRFVEEAPCEELFRAPAHPYTRSLLAAAGTSAAGEPPRAGEAPAGCAFSNRCGDAISVCSRVVPPWESESPTHRVACHRWRELQSRV